MVNDNSDDVDETDVTSGKGSTLGSTDTVGSPDAGSSVDVDVAGAASVGSMLVGSCADDNSDEVDVVGTTDGLKARPIVFVKKSALAIELLLNSSPVPEATVTVGAMSAKPEIE
ncbi:hypothetical protein BRAO285_2640001 [Bradyrhizobium sp. ORS 285]|uniref:hypothetical protein n=1 Tax=Bradyrhizobium sp. ORS 285 TaxID=115808 RepID=UPI0002406D9C|nr:hypothetical protein [Bradyrhizobium sp. ORS 285]CCD87869.1 hypothetical protein BRAO285_2640001 [Bradyrhizobium sp. ORS 285]